MGKLFKQKLKAAFIHLSLSALILSSFIFYVWFVWYPAPYAELNGLNNVITVLVSVDLILGPLLTLILYRKNKPRLKLDLSIIATIQLCALFYGMYAIYKGHPAYVVFAVDRFELISAKDVNPQQAKYEDFKISKLWRPKLVYAQIPQDREEHNRLLFEVLLDGKPGVQWRPQYYEPIEQHLSDMLERAWDPAKIFDNDTKQEKLRAFLKKQQGKTQDFAFFPLVGKEKDIVVAIRRDNGKIIGSIDVYPWGVR